MTNLVFIFLSHLQTAAADDSVLTASKATAKISDGLRFGVGSPVCPHNRRFSIVVARHFASTNVIEAIVRFAVDTNYVATDEINITQIAMDHLFASMGSQICAYGRRKIFANPVTFAYREYFFEDRQRFNSKIC